MRNAQVAKRLDLTTAGNLATVLIGKANLADALVDANIEPGRLRVLPGGPVPPNPSELIGSERMRGLLTELTEMSDIVLIDTPPVLVVSDAIPLLEQVSGVLVVAQLGKTNSEAVSRLATVVRTARGSLLGVAATGARGGGLYGRQGYGAYAYASSNGGEPADGTTTGDNGETRRRSGLKGRFSRRS
jgi:capsular exopolysaccharide synthesis family protein